jgi:D-alanyl-lipoteichoic acid acyltransferase DltB (MBOAT superfamily)
VVDCIALLYGMQLRPNFARLFSVENPSQFWYAWRGTMTRWLVQYVYIPLGGNRHAQVRNIFAAFAVSCLWHCSGVSFLHYDTGPLDYLPIVAWATVNASVISAYVVWRRHGGRILPATTPTVVRRGLHRFGTMCFGSVTPTFLGFHGELVAHFPRFVLRLLGM